MSQDLPEALQVLSKRVLSAAEKEKVVSLSMICVAYTVNIMQADLSDLLMSAAWLPFPLTHRQAAVQAY